MLNRLLELAHSKIYWFGLLGLGVVLEAAALYYQYALDYLPCVLCIHVRIWVLGFMLIALLALLVRQYRYGAMISHLLNTGMMIGGLERSWYLLAVERGWVFGSCDMDSGLPAWFQLDQWFPAMFKVWEACGYTPYVLFKVSMAESLLVIFSLLFLVSAALSVICIREQYLKVKT